MYSEVKGIFKIKRQIVLKLQTRLAAPPLGEQHCKESNAELYTSKIMKNSSPGSPCTTIFCPSSNWTGSNASATVRRSHLSRDSERQESKEFHYVFGMLKKKKVKFKQKQNSTEEQPTSMPTQHPNRRVLVAWEQHLSQQDRLPITADSAQSPPLTLASLDQLHPMAKG